MELIEIKNNPWLLTREAFEIYGQCMYKASFQKYADEIENVRESSDCRIFACEDSGEYKGIIVLKLIVEDSAEIVGISVKKELKKMGIGRFMIFSAAESLHLKKLNAETDGDAIGFYERTGFSVKPFIRHFRDGDVTRYKCSLSL